MCRTTMKGKLYFYSKVNGICLADSELKNRPELRFINTQEIFEFFNDISQNSGIPKGNIEGNGYSTVEYPANGEASDWMLGKHGILAMSPELGTSDKRTEDFFIKDPQVLKETLSQNYPWIKYTMFKLMSQINLKIENVFEPKRKNFDATEIVLRLKL